MGGAIDGVTFGVGGAQAATDHPPRTTTNTTMFRATLIMFLQHASVCCSDLAPIRRNRRANIPPVVISTTQGLQRSTEASVRIRLRRISAAPVLNAGANIHNACLPTGMNTAAFPTWYRSPPAHFRQDCRAFKQFAYSVQDRSGSFPSRLGGFEETGSGTKLALLRSGELSPES